jgi:ankyrin repeat protein
MSTSITSWLAAAERGDLQALEQMYVSDPPVLDAFGQGPYWTGEARALHFATFRGHLHVVRWLLDRGSSPNHVRGEFDWAPIHFACLPLRPRVYELLVRRGATPDIFTAAARGDVRQLRRLLGDNPRLVRRLGPDGATPLHFASTPAIARALLSAGASPRQRDRYHKSTPLEWTLERPAVARVIADAGGGMTVFVAAAIGDTKAMTGFLRSNPRLVNAKIGKNKEFAGPGETPLGIAARCGQRAMVRFLLENGASATGAAAPLPGAVSKGDLQIIRRLLAAGADPNAFGPQGYASLHAACIHGKLPIVRLLLSHGARLDLRDREYGGTALGWAAHHHHARLVEFLRSRGGR